MAEPDPARDPVPPVSLPPLPGLGDAPWTGVLTWWRRLDSAARPVVAGAALLAAVALAAGGLSLTRSGPVTPEVVLPTAQPAAPEVIEVVVHAAGAVVRPGVYRVPDGARVADLIDAAGGPTADADLDRLNLAAGVRDGEQVYVPRIGEPGAAAPGSAADDGVVDLNTATAAELETLPGVGPATAQAILDWRDEHGPFTSVDQLLEVRGIGEAKLAAIRDQVRV